MTSFVFERQKYYVTMAEAKQKQRQRELQRLTSRQCFLDIPSEEVGSERGEWWTKRVGGNKLN